MGTGKRASRAGWSAQQRQETVSPKWICKPSGDPWGRGDARARARERRRAGSGKGRSRRQQAGEQTGRGGAVQHTHASGGQASAGGVAGKARSVRVCRWVEERQDRAGALLAGSSVCPFAHRTFRRHLACFPFSSPSPQQRHAARRTQGRASHAHASFLFIVATTIIRESTATWALPPQRTQRRATTSRLPLTKP